MSFKGIICEMIGHSRIISMCWGYVHCGRCDQQIGDTLAGIYNLEGYVIIGHNCKACKKNYKKLTWRDKLLVSNPLKKEHKK